MRKEVLENMTLTRHIESKRNREKQGVTYVTSSCKCLINQALGEIPKRQILRRLTKKKQLIVESPERSRPEETNHI